VSPWSRLRGAVERRIHGPYRSLGLLEAQLRDVQARLTETEQTIADVRALVSAIHDHTDQTLGVVSGEMRSALRALLAEEAPNRRSLNRMREDAEYETAWTDPRPLVTVTVATRQRPELLATRSLPSILAQTYTELEVIVVGDDADEATAEAVASLNDSRLTYRNLPHRLQFTDDPYKLWLVGATMARNEANRLARGRWVVCFDDDDAMRPGCVERLLERAVEDRSEAVYGQAMVCRDGENPFPIGAFPPALGQFTWAAGMYHAGLRFLDRQLFAAELSVPGDWFLTERMLRAGVRFGMVDSVLCDVYPSPKNKVRPPARPD
jgi:hypothetical protein